MLSPKSGTILLPARRWLSGGGGVGGCSGDSQWRQ